MADYPYNNAPFIHPSALFTTDPAPAQPYLYQEPPLQQQQPSPIEYHFHYHYPPQPPIYFTMAGKRVHFEDDAPRTPSPTLSSSSRASSQGPYTPETYTQSLPRVQGQYPQSQYGTYLTAQDPYASKSYPSPASGTPSPLNASVHPLFAPAAFAYPNSQPFVWNIADHPNQLHSRTPSRSAPGYPIQPATLALPATSPPVAQLLITCALVPFHIIVTPSKLFGQAYVTVGDVLHELYAQLRTQVSADEYNRLCQGAPHVKHSISAAFFTRCSMLKEGRREEEQRGIRRVDLLMGTLMFAGLEMRSSGTAVLHVRPLA